MQFIHTLVDGFCFAEAFRNLVKESYGENRYNYGSERTKAII